MASFEYFRNGLALRIRRYLIVSRAEIGERQVPSANML